jgi:hypothetical protein
MRSINDIVKSAEGDVSAPTVGQQRDLFQVAIALRAAAHVPRPILARGGWVGFNGAGIFLLMIF